MRKRTVKNVAETILWYTLYLLPIICLLMSFAFFGTEAFAEDFCVNDGDYFNIPCHYSDAAFREVMFDFVSSDNLVVIALEKIFGDEGILPFAWISSSGIHLYCSWLVYVTLLRLFVDFILFIPRLAQKWMNGFTQGD